jgi:hypothetical protein
MGIESYMRWQPTIGDPTFMGWFTVFAYAVAALLAGWTAIKVGPTHVLDSGARVRTIWILVACLLGFLCVNKQLDLQSLFTDMARAVFKSHGWYDERRAVQWWFVLGVLVCSGAFAWWFSWRYRAFWKSHTLLVVGLFVLLTFIVVRAISFHHVDQFLKIRLEGVKMNWLLELTGILLVSVAAGRDLWKTGSLRRN